MSRRTVLDPIALAWAYAEDAPIHDCHSANQWAKGYHRRYPDWASQRCGFYYTDAAKYQGIAAKCEGCAWAEAAIQDLHEEANRG